MTQSDTYKFDVASAKSSASVRRDSYEARFVDVRILKILEDMMPSTISGVNSRAMHERYIPVRKMLMNKKGVPTFLERLGKDAPVAMNFGIKYLVELSLCITSEEKLFLLIQAADELAENDHKPALFHAK